MIVTEDLSICPNTQKVYKSPSQHFRHEKTVFKEPVLLESQRVFVALAAKVRKTGSQEPRKQAPSSEGRLGQDPVHAQLGVCRHTERGQEPRAVNRLCP